MVDSRNLQSLIALLFISRVTCDTCFTTDGGYYYCSGKFYRIQWKCSSLFLAGQTCGTEYGDCQGLPTYAIIGLISVSIMILSICIRCCIYANANNNPQPIRRRIVRARPITRAGRVYVTPDGTAYATRPVSTIVPVHTIVEDAPPSYEVATSTGPPKY